MDYSALFAEMDERRIESTFNSPVFGDEFQLKPAHLDHDRSRSK